MVISFVPDRGLNSAAGLSRHPPRLNPEAAVLGQALRAAGVPLISITNTARRGETWTSVIRSLGGPEFLHVVTSCEVGHGKPRPEIFQEAARRLGLPPREILHVGDRWDLDVEGALRAGFGAGLYTGLWASYPDEVDAGPDPPNGEAGPGVPEVLRIGNLEELLDSGRFVA